MNNTCTLFEELRPNNYLEALAIARMYERREQSTAVYYRDAVRGEGYLYITPIGIIDKASK